VPLCFDAALLAAEAGSSDEEIACTVAVGGFGRLGG
jgi:hypothetical protein